jgi:hypothetical protein
MPYANYSAEEVVSRGEAIYRERLRDKVESGNKGKFLVLDIESGQYEVDRDHAAAAMRLVHRIPQAVIYSLRIGHSTAYHLGGRIGRTTPC